MKYSFENLEVWQLSRSMVKDIYELTSAFPKEEQLNTLREKIDHIGRMLNALYKSSK